jgi:hypothetical protein
MQLTEVLSWLNARGLPFTWRAEPQVGKRSAILRPPPGQLLSLGPLEAAIVIPDMHLGVGNDVFRTADVRGTNPARFLRFLQALATLRDQLGGDKFRVVQVGDWYDLFRAPLPTVELQIAAIEAQYKDICDAARELPVAHCIVNHDADLYKHPNVTTSIFGIAQPVGSSRIMAYHGHDTMALDTLQAMNIKEAIAVNAVNVLAFLPFLGQLANAAQRIFDNSFQDPWTQGNEGGDLPWEAAKGAPPIGWDAPWVARDDTAALVRAARGLEYFTEEPIEIVFVGHSHRPGIASASITAERRVTLVDVGSWTYGRAEIGIVTPDGVGLAAMPVV